MSWYRALPNSTTRIVDVAGEAWVPDERRQKVSSVTASPVARLAEPYQRKPVEGVHEIVSGWHQVEVVEIGSRRGGVGTCLTAKD